MNEMERVVRCKYCKEPEYYGEFRWLNGKMLCRSCYKAAYEEYYGEPYKWDDLEGDQKNECQ